METQNNYPIKKSILTKLSEIFLIFLILVLLNLISVVVSYLSFHKILAFLNKNFILLTLLLISLFFGFILKDINSRLRYISPFFYALGGLLLLIISINSVVDLEFGVGLEYINLVRTNIAVTYSLTFIIILLMDYFTIFTGMTQSELTGSICKFNMFSFCLFMDTVMKIERIFERIGKNIEKIISYIELRAIKK